MEQNINKDSAKVEDKELDWIVYNPVKGKILVLVDVPAKEIKTDKGVIVAPLKVTNPLRFTGHGRGVVLAVGEPKNGKCVVEVGDRIIWQRYAEIIVDKEKGYGILDESAVMAIVDADEFANNNKNIG